jgi:uncharacterized membrane protein YhaH (DUF805 family)
VRKSSEKRRPGGGGLKIGQRAYWILAAAVLVILLGAALWAGRPIVFTWNLATAFQLLARLLAAFAPFTLLYAGRLRDIGRSNWWALLIPAATLSLLFGGLNLAFSLQETVETWEFSWTLLMLEGTLLLSAIVWLAPTIWLGTRSSATGTRP